MTHEQTDLTTLSATQAGPADQAPETPAADAGADFGEAFETAASRPEASGQSQDEAATPDYRRLYEQERHRRKSAEGRLRRLDCQAGDRAAAAETSAAFPPADPPAGPLNDEALAEALPVLQELEAQRHMAAIAAAHPDWREVAADAALAAWIDGHPGFLAQRLRQVVDSGTAGEVVELLSRFKDERRRGQDLAQAASSAASAAAEAEVRRRLAALAATAVPSRPAGAPSGRPDPADFRTAWHEAARAGK